MHIDGTKVGTMSGAYDTERRTVRKNEHNTETQEQYYLTLSLSMFLSLPLLEVEDGYEEVK